VTRSTTTQLLVRRTDTITTSKISLASLPSSVRYEKGRKADTREVKQALVLALPLDHERGDGGP
jgi:hypothetical protein